MFAILVGCGSVPSESQFATPTPAVLDPVTPSPALTASPSPEPVLWAAGCGSAAYPGCVCARDEGYCEQGVLARSDDLGETWSRTFFEKGLGSVEFSSPANGWAVGAGGFVVRSTDGGQAWVRKADGIRLPDVATARGLHAFNTVRFLDANRGIIAGWGYTDDFIGLSEAGVKRYRAEVFVLVTTDAGDTWAPATIIGGASVPGAIYGGRTFVSSACFAGDGVGVIAGSPILATRDGGFTWQNITERSGLDSAMGAACDASGTLWLTNHGARVVRSQDRGETWAVVADGLPAACCTASLEFTTSQLGWRAGHEMLRTDDGGYSWSNIEAAIPEIASASAIRFATQNDGLWTTTGIGGVTHDGGANWHVVPIVNYRDGYFGLPDVVVTSGGARLVNSDPRAR